MNLDGQLYSAYECVLRELQGLEDAARCVSELDVMQKALSQFQSIQQIQVPDFNLGPQMQLQHYVLSLLPTLESYNNLLSCSPDSIEFCEAFNSLNKSMRQNLQENEYFEFLVKLYNFCIQKCLYLIRDLIFNLIRASGIQMRQFQLSAQNRKQQIYKSFKQFQLIKLLDSKVLTFLHEFQKQKTNLFHSTFQQPYLEIAKQFYLENYASQSWIDVKVPLNKFQLFFGVKKRLLNDYYVYYPRSKQRTLQIFPEQRIQFNSESIQEICDEIPIQFEELNNRLGQVYAAPVQAQVSFFFSNERFNELCQIVSHKSFFECNSIEEMQLKRLLHILQQIQFESGVQMELLNESIDIFQDLYKEFLRNDFGVYFNVLAIIITQKFNDRICHVKNVENTAIFKILTEFKLFYDQLIANFIIEQIQSLKSNQIYEQFLKNTLNEKQFQISVIPPNYIFNSVYLFILLDKIDNPHTQLLFKQILFQLEVDLEWCEKNEEERFIMQCRNLNSYYVLIQIFKYENVKKYEECELRLEQLKCEVQNYLQKRFFNENKEITKKIIKLNIEAEPILILDPQVREWLTE